MAPFTGLSPRFFGKLVTALRREGADPVRNGRPWSLPLEDRVLLVVAYWRTNLTLRQLAPLFGISKSAADRIIDHLGPLLALQPRRRFRKDTVLIVDGTLVPTRDHTIAEQSKNYRYSTNHQVVIDADIRLVVVVGRPLPGNRNDCKAWEESGAKAAVGKTMTIADGGYPGTGLVMPHRRRKGEELPDWKQAHNKSHKQVRARVEHVFARRKTWKILRDCRLKGDGVYLASQWLRYFSAVLLELGRTETGRWNGERRQSRSAGSCGHSSRWSRAATHRTGRASHRPRLAGSRNPHPNAGRWMKATGELDRLEAPTSLLVRDTPRLPTEPRPHPVVDCYVVAPASANYVAKLATGIADNQARTQVGEALGTVDVPVVVFPRINAAHARHPAWEGHIKTLRKAGVELVYGADVGPLDEPRRGPADRELPWATILGAAHRASGD